jgi:hypothetical protein
MIISPAQVAIYQAEIQAHQSKRIRVLEALRLILATITKDNGYLTDVMEVSYDVKSWRDKSVGQTPVIYLVDDTTFLVTHAGCIREYQWMVRLFGVIRERTIIEFEQFMADVEEAIYDNNTLFGQANLMRVENISTDNQLFSEIDGTHLFEMETKILYTRKYNKPK